MSFYLDNLSRFKSEILTLFILILVIILDYVIGILFKFPDIPSFPSYIYTAYLSRLSSIFLAFYILKYLYIRLSEIINKLADVFSKDSGVSSIIISLRKDIEFLNNPSYHHLSAIIANIIYVFILVMYVFPILHWKPFHIVSNALWVGVLGIGLYIAVFGLRFVVKSLASIREYHIIDPNNEDNMGGLSIVSRFIIRTLILISIAEVLWIGSLIYSIKFYFISAVLIIGLLISSATLSYVIYGLHNVLLSVKSDLLRNHLSKLKNSYMIIHESSIELENKINYLTNLVSEFIIIQQLNKLKVWPIEFKDIMEILGLLINLFPIILSYFHLI